MTITPEQLAQAQALMAQQQQQDQPPKVVRLLAVLLAAFAISTVLGVLAAWATHVYHYTLELL